MITCRASFRSASSVQNMMLQRSLSRLRANLICFGIAAMPEKNTVRAHTIFAFQHSPDERFVVVPRNDARGIFKSPMAV